MGIKINKRVNLGNNTKLNISKSGLSTSHKVGNVTLNPKRNRATINTGMGVSYQTKMTNETKSNDDFDFSSNPIIAIFQFIWLLLKLVWYIGQVIFFGAILLVLLWFVIMIIL